MIGDVVAFGRRDDVRAAVWVLVACVGVGALVCGWRLTVDQWARSDVPDPGGSVVRVCDPPPHTSDLALDCATDQPGAPEAVGAWGGTGHLVHGEGYLRLPLALVGAAALWLAASVAAADRAEGRLSDRSSSRAAHVSGVLAHAVAVVLGAVAVALVVGALVVIVATVLVSTVGAGGAVAGPVGDAFVLLARMVATTGALAVVAVLLALLGRSGAAAVCTVAALLLAAEVVLDQATAGRVALFPGGLLAVLLHGDVASLSPAHTAAHQQVLRLAPPIVWIGVPLLSAGITLVALRRRPFD